mgnify:CR=1 FL=1
MKRIVLIGVVLSSFIGNAQVENNWCSFDQKHAERVNNHPQYSAIVHQALSGLAQRKLDQQKSLLEVPVVVHIIHDNGIGNISDEQVLSALQILNEDYNRQNLDASSTRNTFSTAAMVL